MEPDDGETSPLLHGSQETRMYTMPDYSEEATIIMPANDTRLCNRDISNEDDQYKDSNTTSDDNISDSAVDENTKSNNNRNRILGVVLVIMAGMSFTGGNAIQKFVVPEVTFWQ